MKVNKKTVELVGETVNLRTLIALELLNKAGIQLRLSAKKRVKHQPFFTMEMLERIRWR